MNLEEMSLCRYTYGTPEEYTPVSVLGKRCGSREMDDLPRVDRAPFEKDDILFRTYSCSYVWDKNNLPDPDGLIRDLADQGFHTNAWQHIFIHPDCPFYQEILPYSGNYQVWGGLAPDFSLSQARQIFGEYQKREIVNRGMVGFKLDECDNSDYIAYPWSYPEASQLMEDDGETFDFQKGQRNIITVTSEADGKLTVQSEGGDQGARYIFEEPHTNISSAK